MFSLYGLRDWFYWFWWKSWPGKLGTEVGLERPGMAAFVPFETLADCLICSSSLGAIHTEDSKPWNQHNSGATFLLGWQGGRWLILLHFQGRGSKYITALWFPFLVWSPIVDYNNRKFISLSCHMLVLKQLCITEFLYIKILFFFEFEETASKLLFQWKIHNASTNAPFVRVGHLTHPVSICCPVWTVHAQSSFCAEQPIDQVYSYKSFECFQRPKCWK